MIRNSLPALAIILLVAAFILLWENPPEALRRSEPPPPAKQLAPMAIITNNTTRQFDKTGQLKHEFTSTKAEQFQKNPKRPTPKDYLLLQSPVMTLYTQGQAPWVVRADKGKALNHGQILELRNHVSATRTSSPGKTTELLTEFLRLMPDNQYAETDKPVIMRAPGSMTEAVGLQAYMQDGKVLLLSQVRGIHEPR